MSHCALYVISPPIIPDASAFARDLDRVLAASGAQAFQLRLKGAPDPNTGIEAHAQDDEWRAAAPALFDVCRAHETAFLINDRVDIAAQFEADGVHVGQTDATVGEARAALGENAIIGVTCHASKHLAMEAGEAGADYVAFGAFFDTPTKRVEHRAELEILTWWTELFELPCVAIGGISVDNVQHVASAGADFAAVASGIWGFEHGPEAAGEAFARALKDA